MRDRIVFVFSDDMEILCDWLVLMLCVGAGTD